MTLPPGLRLVQVTRSPDESIRDIFLKPAVPKSCPTICLLNGVPVLEHRWDEKHEIVLERGVGWDIIPRPSDEIVFLCRAGNTGTDAIRIASTLALLVVATVVAPGIGDLAAGALLGTEGGLAAAIGTTAAGAVNALITGTIVVAGSYLLNVLLPPDSAKPGEQVSPTYSLGPSGNMARLDSPIPWLAGRFQIVPDLAAPPFAEFDNHTNNQFIHALYCLGLGRVLPDIEQVNVDTITAWADGELTGNIAGMDIEFIPPGGTVTLYPAPTVTSQSIQNVELRRYQVLGNCTFTAPGTISTSGTLPGTSTLMLSVFAPGDIINLHTQGFVNDGDYTVIDVLDNGATMLIDGPISTASSRASVITTEGWSGPAPLCGPGQVVDQVAFDRVWPNGQYFVNNDGALNFLSIHLEDQVQEIDDAGLPLGPWVRLGTPTYTFATHTAQRNTDKYSLTPARYQARSRRISFTSSDSRAQSQVVWVGLKGRIPFGNVYGNGLVSLMAVKMRATNQLSSQAARQVSVVATAKQPVWDGATWSAPQATRSIAWAATEILRNSDYGAGRVDSEIDLDKFLDLDRTWSARGDTLNGVFDQVQTVWDALGQALKPGRAQPLMVAGLITATRDEAQAFPSGMFSPRNIAKGSFSTTHVFANPQTPDSVIVEYWDERNWSRNEVECVLPGSTSDKPARISLFGVTDRAHAGREGTYQAAVNKYRRILGELTTEMEGRILLRNDQITVNHDVPQWGQSGDITKVERNELTLSVDLDWSGSATQYLQIRSRDSKPWGPIQVTEGAAANIAVINQEYLAAVEASQGSIEDAITTDLSLFPTNFVFGSSVASFRKFLLVTARSRGSEQMSLTLVNDDDRVHTADGTPLPDEDTGIPVPVGTLVVTGVRFATQIGTDPVEILVVWDSTPGATSYLVQMSFNGVGWTDVGTVTTPYTTVVVAAGFIFVRVAAINSFGVGPFDMYPDVVGVPTDLPSTPVITSVTYNYEAGFLTIAWSAAARADQYIISINSESAPGSGVYDTLELTSTLGGTSEMWTSSEISGAGGPWSAFQVSLIGTNDFGASPAATGTVVIAIREDGTFELREDGTVMQREAL